MRKAEIKRQTKETSVELSLNLDGNGAYQIDTGTGFFNHMLELFSVHSQIDLSVFCKGDLDVDCHHTVEDVGICLGQAVKAALADKRGIARFADRVIPMDDCAVLCAVDISGRPYLNFEANLSGKIGDFDSELVEEFLRAFCTHAGINCYVKLLKGGNLHHSAEAVFKALARCMSDAVKVVSDKIPSSKGIL